MNPPDLNASKNTKSKIMHVVIRQGYKRHCFYNQAFVKNRLTSSR